MADIKKTIIDILFEDPDIDDVIEDDDKAGKEAKEPVQESPLKAKDILYRKSDKSIFVDLNEPVKTAEDILKQTEEYEMSSHISPMFGIIGDKKKVEVKKEADESQIKKPTDSHLDIITSPIYGYGTRNDGYVDDTNTANVVEENEDEQLHNLFDEDDKLCDYFSDSQNQSDEEISLFRLFGENK